MCVRECIGSVCQAGHGTVTVNLPLCENVTHAYTVKLKWVTVSLAMSQRLLTHICLWPNCNISSQFNRTKSTAPKQRTCVCVFVMHNSCGEVLCIIYAGMSYGSVLWPLYDRGSASMYNGWESIINYEMRESNTAWGRLQEDRVEGSRESGNSGTSLPSSGKDRNHSTTCRP